LNKRREKINRNNYLNKIPILFWIQKLEKAALATRLKVIRRNLKCKKIFYYKKLAIAFFFKKYLVLKEA